MGTKHNMVCATYWLEAFSAIGINVEDNLSTLVIIQPGPL
jgi:hypothetical protein